MCFLNSNNVLLHFHLVLKIWQVVSLNCVKVYIETKLIVGASHYSFLVMFSIRALAQHAQCAAIRMENIISKRNASTDTLESKYF